MFKFDPESGTVYDGEIRYVMMRPDVLMGTARALGSEARFVQALADSVFANAQASFESYRSRGMLSGDFLAETASFAARLGWGRWRLGGETETAIEVHVCNSPFAFGMGQSDIPVCGPITGILRALYFVARRQNVTVTETACMAQGASHCSFTVSHEAGA